MVRNIKKCTKIPDAAIERLALYTRPLEAFERGGVPVISSEKLAGLCCVNPAQVRKDLAYFGEFGVRGVGYDVRDLLREIKKILATDREWVLCIVGVGHLGRALLENDNFKKRGYKIVAAFDNDPNKIGISLPCGLIVESISKIRKRVSELKIQLGVITTPPEATQRIADRLMDAGVRGILNFSPTQVIAPDGFSVVNEDFAVKFENLAYHLSKVR